MAYTMETSRTADAAKLAVLWRDRMKQGGSVPDHFVEDVFEGGILDELVVPAQTAPPTTNPDGSTAPGAAPEPPLVDHKTVYTDAKAPQLVSLFAAVQDLRAAFSSPTRPGAPGPTDALHPLVEDGGQEQNPFAPARPFFGPDLQTTIADLRALTHGRGFAFGGPDGMQDRVEALRAANKSILDVLLDLRTAAFGAFGPEMTERIRDWIDANGVADRVPGINSGLLGAIEDLSRRLMFIDEQVLGTRVIPQLETAQKDIVSAEKRIRDLEERQSQLEARIGVLESGTSGQ